MPSKSKQGNNNNPPGSSKAGGLGAESPSAAPHDSSSGSAGRLETSPSKPDPVPRQQPSSDTGGVPPGGGRMKVFLSKLGSEPLYAGGSSGSSGALKQSASLPGGSRPCPPAGGPHSPPTVVRFDDKAGRSRETKISGGKSGGESSTPAAAAAKGDDGGSGGGGRAGRADLKKGKKGESSTAGPLVDDSQPRKSMSGGGKQTSTSTTGTSSGRLDASKDNKSGLVQHFSFASLQLESSSALLQHQQASSQASRAASNVIAAGTSAVPVTVPGTVSKEDIKKKKKKKKTEKTSEEILRDLRLIKSKSDIEELQYDRSRQSVVDLARVSQLIDANARISAVKVRSSLWSLPRAPPLYKPIARDRPVLLQIGGVFLKVGNGNAPALSTVQPPLYPFVPYNDLDHLLEERPPPRVLNPDIFVYGPYVFLTDECVTVLETWLRSGLTICNLRLSAMRAAESRDGNRGAGFRRFYLAVVPEGPQGNACSLQYHPNPAGAWWQLTGLGGYRFLAESVSCPGVCLKKGSFGLTLSAPLTNKDRSRLARGQCDQSLVLTIVPLPDAAVQPIAVLERDRQQQQQSAQKLCWYRKVGA